VAKFCLQCRVLAPDDRRFCGQCGQPLATSTEAEAKLRQELHASPGNVEIIEQLVDLCAAAGVPETKIAELRLDWCEALQANDPKGERIDASRRMFVSISYHLLPQEIMERAVRCFVRLCPDDRRPGELVELAARFSLETRGRLPDAAKGIWTQACLRWGDAEIDRRPRWARAFYEVVSDLDPGSPDLAGRLERLRTLEKAAATRKIVAVAGVATTIAVVVVAVLVFRHFGAAELTVTAPYGFQEATVWVSADRASSEPLPRELPGIYHGKVKSGRCSVRVSKPGFADWETTLVLPGARTTSLGFPPLDLSEEAKREAEQQRQAQVQHDEEQRVDQEATMKLVGTWGNFYDTPFSGGKPVLMLTISNEANGRYHLEYSDDLYSKCRGCRETGTWSVSMREVTFQNALGQEVRAMGRLVRTPDGGSPYSLELLTITADEYTWSHGGLTGEDSRARRIRPRDASSATASLPASPSRGSGQARSPSAESSDLSTPVGIFSGRTLEVHLFNVDDHAWVSLNDLPTLSAQYRQDTGFQDITDRCQEGRNVVDFELENRGGGYTWGFEARVDGRTVWREEEGTAGSRGARGDDHRTGTVHQRRLIFVRQAPQEAGSAATQVAEKAAEPGWSVEELSVSSRNRGGVITYPLAAGVSYLVEVSGTYDAWGHVPHAVDALACFADPQCTESRRAKLAQGFRIDGRGLIDLSGGTLTYRPDHTYAVTLTGQGRPLRLLIQDASSSPGDNVGDLSVRITRQD